MNTAADQPPVASRSAPLTAGREHGADLADQVVHAERRAVVRGVGDVGQHRLRDRLHGVEERARAEQQRGHQPDVRGARGDDEAERERQHELRAR